MATEFNVDLPPRYEYNDKLSSEENMQEMDKYVLNLHNSLEVILRNLFNRVSDVAENPTADNIAKVDSDGNVIDAGKVFSTDGTLVGNSDSNVSTEKAVKTYVDANMPNANSIIKGWIEITVSGGTPSIGDSFNVSSITDDGIGLYTITWDTDFANANYAIAGISSDNQYISVTLSSKAVGSVAIRSRDFNGAINDFNPGSIIAIGDQ